MKKDIMKIVFVIIGTMIGAGFASGQEMYLFFFSYGLNGIIGILISCSLMGVVIYKTLQILNKYEIKNYKEFLDILIENKSNKMPFILKNIIIVIHNNFIHILLSFIIFLPFSLSTFIILA